MTGALQSALTRAERQRSRQSSAPTISCFAALLAYVWLMFHCSTYLVVTWRYPEQTPYTFDGVKSLGFLLSVTNVLWAALIAVTFVKVLRGPRDLYKARMLPLVAAFVVVVRMQQFAFLVSGAANW